MERLTNSDFRDILGFTQDLYAIQSHQELIKTIVLGLQRLIRGDVHSYTETDHRKNTAIIQDAPGGPVLSEDQQACYAQFSLQHPTIAYYQSTGNGQTLTISDLVSFSEWSKTDLYNHVYLPHRLRYCLGAGIPVTDDKHVVMGFGVHRGDRDFSGRDRMVLDVVRPHILQAYGNAQSVSEIQRRMDVLTQTVDQLNQAIVEVGQKGRVRWATEKAKVLLGKLGMRKKGEGSYLPSVIWDWLHQCDEQLFDFDHIPRPLVPLDLEMQGSCIRIRQGQSQGTRLLFLEEHIHMLSFDQFHQLGLSPRESEVLGWLAQGKSNPEISKILGIKIGTVKTHLERIYIKLGVDHRHAAMSKALEFLRLHI